MDWKKNDVFQTIIEDMSDSGEGIGKTDGFTWFIKDAVIGDRVEAKAMKVKKSYGFAGCCRCWSLPTREQPLFVQWPVSAADVRFRLWIIRNSCALKKIRSAAICGESEVWNI